MEIVNVQNNDGHVNNKNGIFPSDDEKIRQSVDIGSVFLALEDNFFTVESLLQWLTTVPMTERTQIAYKAVCLKISPNKQYMNDSYHFLTKKPEYTSIAVGFGLVTDLPDQNIPNSNNPIIAHICDAIITINNDAALRRFYILILAGQGSASYIQSKMATCFRARNFPHLRNVSPQQLNVGLVAADWTNKLRYNENLAQLVLRRVAELQTNAPLYYAGVAYKSYHKVAVKLNKEKLLTQLTRDELITFNTFFPDIIDKKVLNYSDLGYKIALLGNDIAGYVLGFPIHIMIPNDDQIHNAIQILTEEGPDKYSERIKAYVTMTYTPILPFQQEGSVSYVNETDITLTEEINNYSPFDIVAYQNGPHMYRFTRVEFSKMVETKKNPWTNEWLPPTILSTIKARVDAAKELGFPSARTVRDMLSRVESGTLYQPDELPKQVPQNTNTQTAAAQVNPFGMLMAAAMMGHWNPGLPIIPDEEMELNNVDTYASNGSNGNSRPTGISFVPDLTTRYPNHTAPGIIPGPEFISLPRIPESNLNIIGDTRDIYNSPNDDRNTEYNVGTEMNSNNEPEFPLNLLDSYWEEDEDIYHDD
jgi:hypothetical protein